MLRVDNLTKSYIGVGTLFTGLTFMLGNKEKVGLVGFNGCGKTTLLKIISGIEVQDFGNVTLDNETVKYLPQEIRLPEDQMVGEYLESLVNDVYTEMYIVDYWKSQFRISDIDQYKTLNQVSEGQKLKLYLLGLLIDKNTPSTNNSPILLLDEPTNHLDIEGILWFEEFIANYKGICIIISHDRSFLNNTVSKIFEIDEHGLSIYHGNYDDYLIGKEKAIEERAKRFHLQEMKREKLENLIESSHKLASGKAKSRAIRAAKKRLEREVLRNEISLYKSNFMNSIDIKGDVHAKKRLLHAKNISFAYDKDVIISNSSMKVWGSDKIWLYGANGCGKTTFIKLLTGELAPQAGEIKWSDDIKFSYFSQDQAHLDMDSTVAEFFMRSAGVSYERSFGALNKFLFDKSLRDNKIRELSPGQRARLSFAIFSQQEYDLMILDEPTNHLDIPTKELIEVAIRDFGGAVIFISHDRYFVEQVSPNRSMTIENSTLVETFGYY